MTVSINIFGGCQYFNLVQVDDYKENDFYNGAL
jgi:hypothetical protein